MLRRGIHPRAKQDGGWVKIGEDFTDLIGLYSLTCLLSRVNVARGLGRLSHLEDFVVLSGILAGF